jgi:DNA-directed RNA polymerase subunit alpha
MPWEINRGKLAATVGEMGKIAILQNNSGAMSNSRWGRAAECFVVCGREPMSRTRIPLNTISNPQDDLAERLEMSTAEIGLSVRTTNCLEERGIFTVDDLLHCTREDLLSISNFGEKTLEEVYKALESIGFYRQSRHAEVSMA